MSLLLTLLLTATGLMDGKTKTDRTIVAETTVDAPPAEVYALWTSPAGVEKFFAPKAEIDPRVGGDYTIIFDPKGDPEGLSTGTKGARILEMDPPHRLSFEWITFTVASEQPGPSDASGPPAVPTAERNARPLPTWVEVMIEPTGAEGRQTRVRLAHYGFRHGDTWDASFAFFEQAWRLVLDQLTALYKAPRPAS
jgi:uncharacterized protein YndB with AHSA1/START domain